MEQIEHTKQTENMELIKRAYQQNVKKRMCILFLSILAALLLTGCSQNIENVEQRDYATIMLVSMPGKEILKHVRLENTVIEDTVSKSAVLESGMYKDNVSVDTMIKTTASFNTVSDSTVSNIQYTGEPETGDMEDVAKRYHFLLGIAKERHTGERGEAEDVFEADADSLDGLSEIYGSRKGKDLSLSHLKVIIVDDDMMCGKVEYNRQYGAGNDEDMAELSDDEIVSNDQYDIEIDEDMMELLDAFDHHEEVAKTCPVLVMSSAVPLLEYIKNADAPVGTYISDLVQLAKRNEERVPKLMDYLKAVREDASLTVYELKDGNGDLRLCHAGEVSGK